jgi:nicotinamidase-related amidase
MQHPASLLCSAEESQLVAIDIQGRLAGAMSEPERERVLRHAGILAEAAGKLKIPVLATEQYPKGLGPTAPAVAEALPPATPMFEKTCFSCGGAEGFLNTLGAGDRRQVVLAGMETHVCVLQTALELHGHGFQVFVVEDAVCSRHPDNHHNAVERLRQAGVIVTNTESVLFEWLRDAGHDQFKAISGLIK